MEDSNWGVKGQPAKQNNGPGEGSRTAKKLPIATTGQTTSLPQPM